MRCIVLFHLLLLFGMYSAQNYKNLALRGEATQAHPYFGADNHTAEMSNPWWRVDLLDSYVITQIIVTNRGDCCEERINGAEIRIGNSNQSNGVENPLAATISSMPRGASQTINITGGMEGRYVTVVIPGSKKILTLCEVEVYGHFVPSKNLALRGKATESSHYRGELGGFVDAYKAIDGNRNPNLRKGSCTHTERESNPWWRVDLLDSYVITQVIVTNRGDCGEERINGANIHIGNSLQNNGVENPRAAIISSIPSGTSQVINIPGHMEGRYVTIVIPGSDQVLTLCEVEVYGYRAPTGENLALLGKATQSSQYQIGDASKAIDGNRRNSVFH
uniref:Si:ch211-215k15.4 n=1 Tax=Poecilia formosa TaxID=48698 RepID=A0A087Y3U5_POEFO